MTTSATSALALPGVQPPLPPGLPTDTDQSPIPPGQPAPVPVARGVMPQAPATRAVNAAALLQVAMRGSDAMPRDTGTLGNTIRLLIDEREVMPELLKAIRAAKTQIDLVMFSWSPSGAGRIIADELLRKARKGVKVHVQVDQVGSAVFPGSSGQKLLDELRAAGVEVSVNHRVDSKGLQPVDHRKVLAIDGRTFFTGGMNLSKKFGKWHDVMVRVDGPAAARMGAELLARWVDEEGLPNATQLRTVTRGAAAPAAGKAAVAIHVNKPGGDLHASDTLLASIAAARDRVWILTPTLSNPEVADAMIAAARRGVDVRVAVSGPKGWIGTRALRLVGAAFYRDLVEAGVRVYEQPGMSHAKVMLVDDTATVGSLNMTRRAMIWDYELNVASNERGFVGQIERLFTTDFSRSNELDHRESRSAVAEAARAVRLLTGLKW